MDDMMEKFREVLSDEESMKQISELAQMFSSPDAEGGTSESKSAPKAESSENPFGDFDFAKIMQISQLMGSVQEDKNAGLLLALKPLLKEERRQKVDKAVKMLKLLAVWSVLKDSGMLKDLF